MSVETSCELIPWFHLQHNQQICVKVIQMDIKLFVYRVTTVCVFVHVVT